MVNLLPLLLLCLSLNVCVSCVRADDESALAIHRFPKTNGIPHKGGLHSFAISPMLDIEAGRFFCFWAEGEKQPRVFTVFEFSRNESELKLLTRLPRVSSALFLQGTSEKILVVTREDGSIGLIDYDGMLVARFPVGESLSPISAAPDTVTTNAVLVWNDRRLHAFGLSRDGVLGPIVDVRALVSPDPSILATIRYGQGQSDNSIVTISKISDGKQVSKVAWNLPEGFYPWWISGDGNTLQGPYVREVDPDTQQKSWASLKDGELTIIGPAEWNILNGAVRPGRPEMVAVSRISESRRSDSRTIVSPKDWIKALADASNTLCLVNGDEATVIADQIPRSTGFYSWERSGNGIVALQRNSDSTNAMHVIYVPVPL